MKINPHLLRLVCLIIFLAPVFAQDQKSIKPQTLITESKILFSQFILDRRHFVKLRGKASFQATRLNSDISLTGIFIYELDETSRQIIARTTQRNLNDILTKIEQKEVVADFAKNTKCPTLRFNFRPMKLNLVGMKISLNNFVLEMSETDQQVSKLICIYAERYARIDPISLFIRRVNRLLVGLEDNE